jgi:peptidoglycan/LPS O-acetylase OafA/YrhL
MTKINFDARRIPALDGIRGIAIIMVMIAHLEILHGGNFGVDLFFVLSGFLITSILLQEQRQNGAISISKFYLRRALRLLPALFALVLSVLLFNLLLQPFSKFLLTLNDAWKVILYIWNWELALEGIGRIGGHYQGMFGHLWSLSVEEQFYLIWPSLLIALLRKSTRVVLLSLFVGMAAEALMRYLLSDDGLSLRIYYCTLFHSDGLLYGALVAWLLHWGFVPKEWTKFLLSLAGPIALIVLILVSIPNPLTHGAAYKGLFSFVNLLSAVLIASAIWCPLKPLRWFLEMKPLCWVGKISYGLYLWHYPVTIAIIEHYPITIINPALFHHNKFLEHATVIVLTFVIASISYYKLELPFLKLKEKIGHAKKLSRSMDNLPEVEPVTG